MRRLDRKARGIGLSLGLVMSIAVISCASVPIGKKDLLAFLQVGQTTRQDVYLHLGDPTEQYEGSRIVTYRIGEDEGGLFPVALREEWAVPDEGGFYVTWHREDWTGVRYSLVLVFDETGALRRYSLVQVRSP